MTLVDHSRDHDLTVQGNQAARAWALWHLLEDKDLPSVTWVICDIDDTLAGEVFLDPKNPAVETQREAVQTWARYLHSPVVETAKNGHTEISVEGFAYGVRVRIRASLRTAALPEVA